MEVNPTNASADAAIRAIVREELQPLREQLAEQAGRSRARDVEQIVSGLHAVRGVLREIDHRHRNIGGQGVMRHRFFSDLLQEIKH